MRFTKTFAAAALAVLPAAVAQTFTECDPTAKTCPADVGLNAANYESDFTKGSSAAASWSSAVGTSLDYGSNGAEFTIKKAGQAPTVQTSFYVRSRLHFTRMNSTDAVLDLLRQSRSHHARSAGHWHCELHRPGER